MAAGTHLRPLLEVLPSDVRAFVEPIDYILADFYIKEFTALASAGECFYELGREEAEELAHEIIMASLVQKVAKDDPKVFFAAALHHAIERRKKL
jgi:hypothetical protein